MKRSRFAAARFLMLAGFVSCFPALASAQYRATTFFVAAHQDDWQLFMQPNAFQDAQDPNVKVVFIYLTAGDAGNGAGGIQADGHTAYYAARENGAMRAARFVGTRAGEVPGVGMTSIVTLFPYKHITRYQYNNTVSYFLRLPDGNGNGNGFSGTGFQSLQKLHSGLTPVISDVTGMAVYFGWSDLVATLEWILASEAAGTRSVWVNVQDPDTTVNTGDHSDHTFTGRAMLDAANARPCVNQAKFLDYVTNTMPVNLSVTGQRNEAATWGATVSGLIDSGMRSPYDGAHNSWLGRNYYSIAWGTGACIL